jgi:hypothetical protein
MIMQQTLKSRVKEFHNKLALDTNDVLFSFLSMIRTNLYNEKLTNA